LSRYRDDRAIYSVVPHGKIGVLSLIWHVPPIISGSHPKWDADLHCGPARRRPEEFQTLVAAVERFEPLAGNSQT